MRAWQITEVGAPVDVLRMVDIPEPVPGPGEVALQVHAAGIGMPDAFMCRSTYAFSPSLPFVPGQEMCGTVVAVGEGSTARVGDRLMGVTSFYDGRGGLAEFTIASDATLFRVPEDMSSSDAATFRIGYSTALIGLQRRGEVQAGETVVVLGASGGSGSTAVQIAAALGARVLAVVSTPEKAALSTALGASAVIDRSEVDVASAVNEMTDGRGADLVYDPVGGDLANATLKCLAPGGRLLAVGFASGQWTNPPVAELVRRNVSLVGVYAGGIGRTENESDHELLLSLYGQGKLQSFVTEVSFEHGVDAVVAVDEGTVVGKSVVAVSHE
ncbi:MAG: zinc-binding dehydrogenase [Actinobacteria bacterium]|nr:zinc-binding dehydrogenase [Actinomycetota bacterium]MSW31226.1 zinc-binding dehydrogenase [Actinomycetota bacterium]MSX33338.1 zinc-binding dehydrogenase [Actinomycetota bacterium]MSX95148.1 zinc-binding dehydrogenase [Actinomycetota bacterium]MSY24230.1 zinc-binding dehydrogenase [Actinomycetota bacterium]